MSTEKVQPFVEDFEDLQPSIPQVSTSVPPPATTTSTPTQQTGPATPPPAPTQPTATASATSVDDVDDVPTGKAAKTTPKSVDEYDVAFGDEKLMSKSDGLDILRPEKGKTVRFALLDNYVHAKRAFNHYIDKKGTYHCLSPEKNDAICCTKLGNSQPQIVTLVLHYTNANPKTGRYDKDGAGVRPPVQWEIKFVRLSRSAFRRVSSLVEEDGSAQDIDITMNHRDSGIGYEYNKVSSAARWKKNPQLVAEVEAAIQQFADGKKLLSKLGKKISLLEFKAIIAGTTQSDEADLSQVDDI
jgi:hypothetical protein